MFGFVIGNFGQCAVIPQRSDPLHQADHIDGAGTDGVGADRAILNRCDQFVAAVARGAGHFQIKTCVDGGGGGA